MSDAIAIIPARYGSTRFPGKALALLAGKPLIQHVCERARECRSVERVIVATDDERIAAVVRRLGETLGVECAMTRADHVNGTSRIAEVASRLPSSAGDLIVNIQGDEPQIEAPLVDRTVEALRRADPSIPMATLASPFAQGEDPTNPNMVKVVVAPDGRALYFSRSFIPFDRGAATRTQREDVLAPLKHVGLYVYRRPFLAEFAAMPSTPLERTEQLEQLRVLEHGRSIVVAIGIAHFHGVDTPEQLAALEARLAASRR